MSGARRWIMYRCPVCGARVDPFDPPATSYYDVQTYTFCCNECKQEFDMEPESFADVADASGVGVA
jgi:YHS domain-containing protein